MSSGSGDHEEDDLLDRISAAPPQPHGAERAEASAVRAQWLHVVAIGLITAAAIGFVTGTRGEQAPYRRDRAPAPELEAPLPLAPTYSDIRESPLGPGRQRHASAIAAMSRAHPRPTDDVPPRDDEAVRAELARRATLRAYDGAPPRIPHPIAANGPLECAACHRDGIRIGEHVAPPMSHRELASCTQCHVPTEGPMPGERLAGGPSEVSTFSGMPSPERGPRMWPVAPPQIPHSTQMRDRCDSCHGVWADALRTTHPWRQSCTQCHTSSAARDQHPSALEGGPPVSPMPGDAPPGSTP